MLVNSTEFEIKLTYDCSLLLSEENSKINSRRKGSNYVLLYAQNVQMEICQSGEKMGNCWNIRDESRICRSVVSGEQNLIEPVRRI